MIVPYSKKVLFLARILSTARHEESCRKLGRPISKPKYYLTTDSEKYCEGKVKRTLERELKILKLSAYKPSESVKWIMAYALDSGSASYIFKQD